MSDHSTIEDEADSDKINLIKQKFSPHDDEKNDTIALQKVNDVLRSLGLTLKKDQFAEVMHCLKCEGTGRVSWEVFYPVVLKKLKEKEEVAFYKSLFRMLDKKKTGIIPCDDLKYILQGMAKDLDLTDDDVDTIINDIDENGDGEVSFEEFYNLMVSE